jgi:hypothetical protein
VKSDTLHPRHNQWYGPKSLMDLFGVLEIAPVAIEKVARITARLGVIEKREVCGRLGGELFIAATYLKSLETEQDDETTRKILRFLRNIENIFSDSTCPSGDYRCLRSITEQDTSTRIYRDAEDRIKASALHITSGKSAVAEKVCKFPTKMTRFLVNQNNEDYRSYSKIYRRWRHLNAGCRRGRHSQEVNASRVPRGDELTRLRRLTRTYDLHLPTRPFAIIDCGLR